jgi:hypothetical protein
MKELAIVKYIKLHGLAKAIETFKLKTNVCENKILLKYNQLESPMAFEETQDCRGLILERDTWKVMSLAFRKFFNHEEGHAAKIDWNTAKILEKVDGSLIQLYWDWHKNQWLVGTTGTPEADGEVNNKFGTTFAKLFWTTLKNMVPNFHEAVLTKGFTYAFELTTPYNIVVKPHETSSLTLLGVRNLETLEELSYDDLHEIIWALRVPVVKQFDINAMDIGAIRRTFENMPDPFFEGYVIVDDNFNRVKMKTPSYVALHHLKSKSSQYEIMQVIKTNEIEEYLVYVPERKDEMLELKGKYDVFINDLENTWVDIVNYIPQSTTIVERKVIANIVLSISKQNGFSDFTGLFFGLYDGKHNSIKEYMVTYNNKQLYKRVIDYLS